MEPDGEWADDALLLMGRAYLRVGRSECGTRCPGAGRAHHRRRSGPPGREALPGCVVRGGDGDFPAAIPLLDEALAGLRPGHVMAEGHLWRARALLEHGEQDAGWWDLDRAAAGSGPVRVAAAIERIIWGVHYDDRRRAEEGMNRLLALSGAGPAAGHRGRARMAYRVALGPGRRRVQLMAGPTRPLEPGCPGRSSPGARAAAAGDGRHGGRPEGVERVADGIGEAAVGARLDLARWTARARA